MNRVRPADGKRADKVKAGFGNEAKLIYYANLAVTAACLFDYAFLQHRWASETLAIVVLVSDQQFALWQRRYDLKRALELDRLEEEAKARSVAEREARLSSKGLL